jgi:hypothetical protein
METNETTGKRVITIETRYDVWVQRHIEINEEDLENQDFLDSIKEKVIQEGADVRDYEGNYLSVDFGYSDTKESYILVDDEREIKL